MKKILIISILVLFFNESRAQLFTYGPKLGVNLTTFNPNQVDGSAGSYSAKGGNASAMIAFFFIKDFKGFFLQFEPTYSTLKGTWEGPSSTDIKLSTFSLPVMIGKKINMFRLYTGLSPGFPIGGTVSDEDFQKEESLLIDFTLGVGLDVSNVVFNLRYAKSIGIPAFYYSGVSELTDLPTSQIIFNVGIKLNK